MSATKHSAEVFVLIDPVQNYEESTTILGVYGSLAAAKAAMRAHRRRGYEHGGVYGEFDQWRDSQVQQWRGDTVIASWTFSPNDGWRADARPVETTHA